MIEGWMTTVHATTATHRKPLMARLTKMARRPWLFPATSSRPLPVLSACRHRQLNGKLTGMAFRVPT
ncbi:hypothetical protein ACLB1E_20380 [Escherichia coli]